MSFCFETYLKQKSEKAITLVKNEFRDNKIYAHFKRFKESTGESKPDIIQEVDIIALNWNITHLETQLNSLKSLLDDCNIL